ncbi:glutathione synthetase, chloroplastic-like isoform X2 [Triticum urartu]|uniref:glutathione synthetase, chloroplastic-like isoform X2 n=1 Tax=Triticum urartu TaxID=4572 RepID=UPI002044C86B|nr:glutathione synthetase, chloroplastic-like isoform X2 [Triticum urartu]
MTMAAANALTGASVSRGAGASMSGSVTVVCPRSVVAAAPTSRTSSLRPVRCGVVGTAAPVVATAEGDDGRRFGQLAAPPGLVDELVEEALVWCSQHGLVVGDKNHPRSGKAPGVGLLHAPFALLPMSFPKVYWEQALELAPLFNELVHRVSLDGDFLQQTLARTKEVDPFTRRLLDIHSKMMELNKKEDIQLGLTRSDYMVDGATDKLLQVELNTISTSSNGLACGVSELHRNLIRHHERELGLDPASVVGNTAITQHAEALATAWAEYNNQSAVVLVVVQAEERYMYDQYWITVALREMYGVTTIRKTMAEIEAEGDLRPDGTLVINGRPVAVVYFRAGYSPADYPSEAEWRARLLIERSSSIKCPSIAHHLVGTKKIQQELAKEKVLERFLDNKSDIENVRKCFAGLWSLETDNIVNSAIESPELFVLKPQREGGGNNIYGDNLRETLIRLRKDGSNEIAAYILMQRIFPPTSPSYLVREGTFVRDNVVSEFGIFGAYLRNKDKVIINDQCGYLLRTKAASLNEGGVVAGYAFLNSIFLT